MSEVISASMWPHDFEREDNFPEQSQNLHAAYLRRTCASSESCKLTTTSSHRSVLADRIPDLRNNPRFEGVSSQLGKTLGGRDQVAGRNAIPVSRIQRSKVQGEHKIGGVPLPMNGVEPRDTNEIWSKDSGSDGPGIPLQAADG